MVIHAWGPDNSELAVKVHTSRVFTDSHKRRYIFGDWRFRHAKHHIVLRTNAIWAEKEYRNLARLSKAAVPAPKPVAFEENIVVMGFIGDGGVPAPKLYDLQSADFGGISEKLLELVRRLVLRAKIIHSDLSPQNVLVWKERPYLIDLSQGVLSTHLNAADLLKRDINNIKDFLSEKGIEVQDYDSLLEELLPKVEQPRHLPIDRYGYTRRPKP